MCQTNPVQYCVSLQPQVTLQHGPYNAVLALMRVLLTRPEAQSRAFARLLDPRFDVIFSPLIKIIFLDVSIDFSAFDAVAFTSQNGVMAYQSLNGPPGIPAFCVGDKTADVARQAGLKAQSAGGNVDDLNQLVSRLNPRPRILHLSGRHTSGTLGDDVTRVAAYDQVAQPLNDSAKAALQLNGDLAIPLFSPRTAEIFQNQLQRSVSSSLHVVCLSQSISSGLDLERFASVRTCGTPTVLSMRDKMSELLPATPA